MFSNMLEWRGHNPPQATMMLISNQVEDVFSWDLLRLQQHTQYNLFLAYLVRRNYSSILFALKQWDWKRLLESADNKLLFQCKIIGELSALFSCKSCSLDGQSLDNFRKHLSSKKHALKEHTNPNYTELDSVTRKWGRNYAAKPEYATAKIAVWWDMMDCPIPEGYDARRVRPSMEAAFKNLGDSGPVSVTAYGDQKQAHDHLLRGLSSTEVIYKRMFSDMLKWRRHNPPPATMMLISDHVEMNFACLLVELQQWRKYNFFWLIRLGLTKCQSWSLMQSGSGKAYLQFQRQEDMFFRSAVKGVKNLPECFIANCVYVIAKALMISGSISQLKNMHGKRIELLSLIDLPRTRKSDG